MSTQPAKRSVTGKHNLLPASGVRGVTITFFAAPGNFVVWTFGRGTVLWRIWPAVLLHTLFAVAVTVLSEKSTIYLGIPNVLLTVLGVVIGFVISYRASSGYDRYWMGRTAWSDVIRNIRTLSRLIWFHVPLRLAPKSSPDAPLDESEIRDVMKEKRLAVDLIEACVIAVKHHLRSEAGIYYEDLYHLTRPFHKHPHHDFTPKGPNTTIEPEPQASTSAHLHSQYDPIIPPINSYGSFGNLRGRAHSSRSSSRSSQGEQTPLLPSARPDGRSMWARFSADLVPFAAEVRSLARFVPFRKQSLSDYDNAVGSGGGGGGGVQRRFRTEPTKHRPRVVCDGENLPLEIVNFLSNWFSELEDRGTVPGTSLGSMIGCLAAMEDSISTLERILTTPLPFVFSAHIRPSSTVWIYLFFLPFQLVEQFHWHTILGVAIASFIYLGFIAAGEEIEQPFGYDENDLDLDLFCREVIHTDLERLRRTPGANVFLGSHRGSHRPDDADGNKVAGGAAA
ncbi:Bestrophin, RFP-TM, chloride channel-domain-containing protein [Vararia minispora EC-137]|uniref:Bestrophin, RFP-TM, chloride channel-domain-containing protein n=1 Tax=Vararia minispora EC-137 TaxID=1314806 RepID=A0ACB8Q656_9AGAM|nr:Bestrophin, RFP-TM, chloride channel-domain-containing protein [Vararia minispora EC-137]